MWYMKNAQGEIIYLKPNKSMVVSRKDAHDIVLKNDASISKIHASITVRPKINFKQNEPSSTVTVKDAGSKYGTFIIDSKNQQHKLPPGDYDITVTDKVKFGLLHHIFTFHYIPLIVSKSALNIDEETELRNVIHSLDGVFIEKWHGYCTHLTVSKAELTTQVVQALAFGTPIVELKYWHAVFQSVGNNEKLPDIANFIPTINEGLISRDSVSLEVKLERKVLFKNLNFICFSISQYSLKNIIKHAGGKLILFKEDQFDLQHLCSENVVFLQLATDTSQPSQAPTASYDVIQRSLQKKKLRLIPETEVFLAILYCSIEKYCNPKFNFRKLIGPSVRNKNTLSSTILAPDTEDVLSTARNVPNVIINDSVTPSEQANEQESANSRRGKLSLRRKQTATESAKDSLQLGLGTKRSLERQTFGSEESSRDSALIIDETRSSVESDSNDASIRRRDFVNEFDGSTDKSKISTTQSSGRRFNLQPKLQTLEVSKKENLDERESCKRSSAKNFQDNCFSGPSTSQDTSLKTARDFEFTHNKDISDVTKVKKTSSSAFDSDSAKLPKRSRVDEDNVLSFVNENAAKRRKNRCQNNKDDCFELMQDTDVENSGWNKNTFKKKINKISDHQIKRRRSSISSNESLIEEEQPQIKVERLDTDDKTDQVPLIRCKQEVNDSINKTCKSSIVSLLRTDIDLTLDNSMENSKTFVKVYTLIPKQRIKLKDMYVWKVRQESIQPALYEDELTSSEDDDNDDFRYFRAEATKNAKQRK